MRGSAVVLLLLLVPLSGCLGTGPKALEPTFETGSVTLGFDSRERSAPAPVPLGDCADVRATLEARLLGEAQARLDHALASGNAGRYYGRGWLDDGMALTGTAAPAAADSAGSGGSARDAEVTGTNNQEAGADEADLVKTDGVWTYVLAQGQLQILRSDQVGDIALVASIPMEGYGGQLLLERGNPDTDRDDRLLVLTSVSDPRPRPDPDTLRADVWMPWYRQMTRVAVFDLADRRAPEMILERHIEGHAAGARLIDGDAHVVVTAWAPRTPLLQYLPVDDALLARHNLTWQQFYDLDVEHRRPVLAEAHANATRQNLERMATVDTEALLPTILEPAADGYKQEPMSRQTCGRLLSPEDSTGLSVNTVWSVDLEGDLDHRTVQVMGSNPIVYAAPGALVLAEQSQDWWWYWDRPHIDEATNLHWFDIDGLAVTHRASGRVAGTVQDSFSLDVADGTLRVITTTGQWGRWWLEDPEPMANHLAVFRAQGDEMVEVGAVSGFAKDERVWSARFTDTRAYVVTFRNIDPLWIIDLSRPSAPRILGELEIPGVSTYLHPINEDRLLAIGIGPRDGDDEGLDWSRVQVSLFDTSEPRDPKRLDVLDLSPGGPGWSWSGATHEHKAFTYWDKIGMLAVPITSGGYTGGPYGTYEHHVALRLIEVGSRELTVYGDVDQDHLLDTDRWWGGQIERSHFLGFPDQWPVRPVSVYAVSQMGVTAHDLSSLRLQDSVAFTPLEQR